MEIEKRRVGELGIVERDIRDVSLVENNVLQSAVDESDIGQLSLMESNISQSAVDERNIIPDTAFEI